MRRRLLFIFLVAFHVSNGLLAQTTEEKEVGRAVERLRNVMVMPNRGILAELASDDLVYVHSSGTVRDKQGFIDEFIKGWTVLSKVALLDQVIKVTGDNAIVRHRLVADTAKEGQPPTIDIIIMLVYRKENGHWKLLARQAAKVPE